MGATENALEEYDPATSPRFIGDDVMPWAPDPDVIHRASEELRLLEAGLSVLGHENWAYIDGTLANEEYKLLNELVHEYDPAKAGVLRGRIMSLQWMRGLPEQVRSDIEANRREIEFQEKGPTTEEEDGGSEEA